MAKLTRREMLEASAVSGVCVLANLPVSAAGQKEADQPPKDEPQFLLIAVEESDNSVGFYDSWSGSEVGRVRLSLWPHEINVSPDGATVYVSNFGLRDYDLTIGHAGNSVSAIDIRGRCELDRYYTCSDNVRYWGPHGVKVSPDAASLYVNVERVVGLREPDPTSPPGQEVTKMLVYDIATKALKRTFNLHAETPLANADKAFRFAVEPSQEFNVPRGSHNFVFSADGKDLWIFSGRNGISKLDPVTGKVVVQLTDFNGACRGLAFTKSGMLLVSATNEVSLVDPKTAQITKKVGNLGVTQILYSKATPDEKHVLAPAVWEGMVLVIDMAAGKVVKRISTGIDPVQVEIAPHGKSAYVTHGRSYWLSEIDLTTFDERHRVKTRGGPNGLAFAPWSPPPTSGPSSTVSSSTWRTRRRPSLAPSPRRAPMRFTASSRATTPLSARACPSPCRTCRTFTSRAAMPAPASVKPRRWSAHSVS